MGNKRLWQQVEWIWEEYLRCDRLGYLGEGTREEPALLTPDDVDRSLLERAIQAGDLAAVQCLIELGARVCVPATGGYTYLHTALESDRFQPAIVQALLDAGANPSQVGIRGFTALHHAAVHGRAEVLGAMLERGADINLRTYIDGEWTPLMVAAIRGQSETIRQLLTLGADASLRDRDGRTAADIAQQHGHSKLAQLLASHRS